MSKVVIITGDPIGKKMAGPAIRSWHMAELLSEKHEVRLISLSGTEQMQGKSEVYFVEPFNDVKFRPHHDWSDVVIFQGHALLVFNELRKSNKILVVDIYDPMHLEQLEQAKDLEFSHWVRSVNDATLVLNDQLSRGDFFICASERQRLFWLGQLAALGRLNPYNYSVDPDLHKLIDIAPFGLSRQSPVHDRPVLKGVIPGIAPNDKVILWAGGLYNWFDPITLVRAVAKLSQRRPNVRLYFLGTQHPHPGVPEMEIVSRTRRLAEELGVLNKAVFFNANWVDFEDRQNYLLESDLGVSTHHSHIETTFSFRTRILDYLWASLPMVVTDGDHFADLVQRRKLGLTVPAEDVSALELALEKGLFDRATINEAKQNVLSVRQDYFWDVVLQPLSTFIDNASHAADRGEILSTGFPQGVLPPTTAKKHGFTSDVKLAFKHFKDGGFRQLMRRVNARLSSKFKN